MFGRITPTGVAWDCGPLAGETLDVDVIFCRNVLIYFDMESRKKVIKDFHDALTPEGHLILGKTESIFSINELFTLVHYPQTIFYRKEVHP